MRNLIQFIKFSIVGLSNTILSLVIYYLCIGFGMHYLVANTIGFFLSVLNAYYWSSKYVFEAENKNKKKIVVRLYLSYGFTFILSSMLLILFVQCFAISDKIAPILNLCITVPLNFILNKFWVYR